MSKPEIRITSLYRKSAVHRQDVDRKLWTQVPQVHFKESQVHIALFSTQLEISSTDLKDALICIVTS